MELITWLITIIALIGSYLNSNRNKKGFYLWIITNTFWCILDYKTGLKAQSFLYLCYIIIALKGLITWSKKEGEEGTNGNRKR